ncbi:hypothetical protein BST36_06990 [Mycolicibacterium moriokaense]|uniref:hypothetical protein n=1 Tax=Mycolicibacterium moriokaense TaxID=39691 RepID=UPI0009F2CD10|nr:hypothetical protein [Mycolicibacterium moriokaense]ORB25763.1 hypothetical protein BST36_06990 [Mycolicibacterium moriokaense]
MAAEEQVRTAVVVVHGMAEKRPMETFDDFVRTALHPHDDQWDHRPRPTVVAETYEARRYVGPRQVEFFEYHWPFLMTAGKYAGVAPTALRLFVRRPSNVPDALLGVWRLVWTTVLVMLSVIPVLFVAGYALNSDVPVWIIGLVTSTVVLIFWFGLYRMLARAVVNKKTAPLVDSARYLEPSPHSYAARRAIRGGLANLLRDLHEDGYTRIVLVAHGVGAFIAYDALMLSRSHRPWGITDFVTLGAPLVYADLLLTRAPLLSGLKASDSTHRRELFEGLLRRGVLAECNDEPFAATRWTNLWFPVVRGSRRGDWFGGALAPLFGAGIRDIEITGNEPERFKRGSAHTEYFSHPDKSADGDIAWHLREILAL